MEHSNLRVGLEPTRSPGRYAYLDDYADARDAAQRFARFVLFSVLLYLTLVLTGSAALSRLDAPAYARSALRGARQQVLLSAMGPPRVGLQIGHEGVQNHPDELAALRFNTGGYAQGVSELEVNQGVAAALQRELKASGVAVDLIGATPPPGYHADLLLALHADSVSDPARRGYKSAHFDPPRSALEPRLKAAVDLAYFAGTALPDDQVSTTGNMRYYYAFNFRSYEHSVHPATPALLVELGYLSSPLDLALLLEPERPAKALAVGVLEFLHERGRLP